MACRNKPYCVRRDVERIFGAQNIGKWANLDNAVDASDYATDSVISERIKYACVLMSDSFDERMRHGPIEIPITRDVPLSVVDVTARLVGIYLHDGRGVTDYAPPDPNSDTIAVSPVAIHARFCDKWFRQVHAGRIKLNLPETCTRAPAAINDPCDDDE